MSGWPARSNRQTAHAGVAATPSGSSERVATLVARYPQVSGSEAAEITKFLKRERYVEIERLASDPKLRRQLDLFLRTHEEELRYSATEVVTFVALIVAFLAICWVLWHPIGGA